MSDLATSARESAEHGAYRSASPSLSTARWPVCDAVTGAVVGWISGTVAGAGPETASLLAMMLAFLSPVGLGVMGTYRAQSRQRQSDAPFGRLMLTGLGCVWVCWVVARMAGWPIGAARLAALSLALPLAWQLTRWVTTRWSRPERVLLVGTGAAADHLLQVLARHPEARLRVIGGLDDAPVETSQVLRLGAVDDLPALLGDGRHGVERVIVTYSLRSDESMLGTLRSCHRYGIPVDVIPRFYELAHCAPAVHRVGALGLLNVLARPIDGPSQVIKRVADIVGSSLALLLLLPCLIVVSLAILIDDGPPILYRQSRIGRHERVFEMLKFRTMVRGAHVGALVRVRELENGRCSIAEVVHRLKHERQDDITRVGRFLRRTSLDELPQLVNVLLGDMSLVGPRPLPLYEAASLTEQQRARHLVRPGLTGLWQVSGRSEVAWDERVTMDLRYVQHQSVWTDVTIALRTIPVLLRRRGAE